MKHTEIRIGNLVNKGVITAIYENECVYVKYKDGKNRQFQFSEIKPIPLTEERLLKFGFTKDGEFYKNASNNQYRPLKIRVAKSTEIENGWYIAIWDEETETVIYDGKYFVHQLQNLYFELTGKEFKP